jgi:hypothetical protein
MDYRHTEDFARRMEREALQARGLRKEALDAFFAGAARALRRGLHAVLARLVHSRRRDKLIPEA